MPIQRTLISDLVANALSHPPYNTPTSTMPADRTQVTELHSIVTSNPSNFPELPSLFARFRVSAPALPEFMTIPRPPSLPRHPTEKPIDAILDALYDATSIPGVSHPLEYWLWVRAVIKGEYKYAHKVATDVNLPDGLTRKRRVKIAHPVGQAFMQRDGHPLEMFRVLQEEFVLVYDACDMLFHKDWFEGKEGMKIALDSHLALAGSVSEVNIERKRKMENRLWRNVKMIDIETLGECEGNKVVGRLEGTGVKCDVGNLEKVMGLWGPE